MTETDKQHCDEYVAYSGAYLTTVRRQLSAEVERIRAELAALKTSIRRRQFAGRLVTSTAAWRESLGADQMKALRLEGTLAGKESSLANISDTALAERYWEMRAVPRVKDILVDEDKALVIETELLYGKCRKGIWRRVGMFTIRIPDGALRVRGMIQFVPGVGTTKWSSYIAPTNVGANGHVGCFGDAADAIDAALCTRDDTALVKILVRYLECPGFSDRLQNWPVVPTAAVPKWYIDTFGA